MRLRDWLLKYKPAVMLVGTSCPEAKDLKKLVDSVRDYLLENMPKELARFSTGVCVFGGGEGWGVYRGYQCVCV